jgi:hypothetical protein
MDRWIELLGELRQMFRSRYVRELENELLRLRAENRAMMNSLLGTVGVPPLQIPEARKESRSAMPAALHSRRLLERRLANPGADPQAGARLEKEAEDISLPPIRRRSWQQIGRILEIEEARRQREHAAQMAQARMSPAAIVARESKPPVAKPNGKG